ncbi:positive regulator of late transcription {Bacteriophage mu) [Haemophilus influenzae Rd KW20]|uniref:Uncharacterized protein HI_1490 n=1 Tax=Haemophilus influenzae (strain ATCC 51907 / DSM 11121 / KW20 / Rd) TaxID=71421 RepID=Y1490_HAEIN|nr:RecName: Full=Uncharacterized protein HI_1490 [Haemophilus influenzae Rd KW20]AAC23134.1 positive regulator of late transcription {Bacteriophage mu) [Haemophilus influenzae Rd KW20]
MSQTLQQTGLFDDEHADIGALFDHLDQIPSVELEKRWPSLLVEVIEVMQAEYCAKILQKIKQKRPLRSSWA